MGCLSTALKGLGTSCATNLAGVKKVWLAEADDVAKVEATMDTDEMTHFVTVTMQAEKKFVGYAIAKQTSSLSSEITIDEANGVRYYTNTLTLSFNKLQAAVHLEVEALAKGQLNAIVLDNNGKYWFLGYDGYVSASAQTAATGQAYGDHNGYETTLQAMSGYLPFEMTAESVADILAEGTIISK